MIVLRHYGSGPHRSGTPQSVHGKGGMGRWKVAEEEKRTDALIAGIGQMTEEELRKHLETEFEPGANKRLVIAAMNELARRRLVAAEAKREANRLAEEALRKATEERLAAEKLAAKPAPLVFKTAKAAQQYANDHLAEFGVERAIDLSGLSTAVATRVLNHLRELSNTYRTGPLGYFTTKTGRDRISAAMGRWCFADFAQYARRIRIRASVTKAEDEAYRESQRGASADDIAYIQRNAGYVETLRNELAGADRTGPRYKAIREQLQAVLKVVHTRYNVFEPGRVTETILTHEFGHHVLARAANVVGFDAEHQWQLVHERLRDTGDIAALSEYAHNGGFRESFSEAFAMYHHGERDKLPDYALKAMTTIIGKARVR